MGWREIIGASEDGAKQSLMIVVACAVVGVVNLTRFGTVMTSPMVTLSAGSLLPTLILTMIASMILGMGLPSIPVDTITVTMTAPALSAFTVPALPAAIR